MKVVLLILIVIVISFGLFFVPISLSWAGERLAGNKGGMGTKPLNDKMNSFESWK